MNLTLNPTTKESMRHAYGPIMWIFILKSLVLSLLMLIFGFQLYPEIVKSLGLTGDYGQHGLGVMFLVSALFGLWSLLSKKRGWMKTFCIVGILFSSGMATGLLMNKPFILSGVGYGLDTAMLIAAFLQIDWANESNKYDIVDRAKYLPRDG